MYVSITLRYSYIGWKGEFKEMTIYAFVTLKSSESETVAMWSVSIVFIP